MIHSRITSKAQTTVPLAVRRALGIRAGDPLNYEIKGDRAVITRVDETVGTHGFVNDFSSFTEWNGEADRTYDELATRFPAGVPGSA